MMPAKHRPFVPEDMKMREFTWRAVLLGLTMTAVLGAANAYLGLRAGQTIAATYPAAVIGMAVLRLMKGAMLEENIARTVGSIGESVAAGAVFTIPRLRASRATWPAFRPRATTGSRLRSDAVGGTLGILFVTLLRRVMVEDPDLPFPESVAASEIHKAGQQGAKAAKILFANMGFGGAGLPAAAQSTCSPPATTSCPRRHSWARARCASARASSNPGAAGAAASPRFAAPTISPAYLGVGYIIGPELAALNFSGGVLAWGLLVPLLIFFLGPAVAQPTCRPTATDQNWLDLATDVWRFIVRPIAVGGMMVGACYTLFRMRKNLARPGRAVSDLKKSAAAHAGTSPHRTRPELARPCSRCIGARFCLHDACCTSIFAGA